jgi:hypothetical protein
MYAPRAFGVEFDSNGSYPQWVIHYKGRMASKKGGRYRFRGWADEILFVRINGKTVLNGSWHGYQDFLSTWRSPSDEHLAYRMMNGYLSVGDWIDLKPGEPVDMEVLVGDHNNPHFGVFLMIEDEDEMEYYGRRTSTTGINDNMPILPAFRTAAIPKSLKEQLKYNMYRDELDLDGGEIFNVY